MVVHLDRATWGITSPTSGTATSRHRGGGPAVALPPAVFGDTDLKERLIGPRLKKNQKTRPKNFLLRSKWARSDSQQRTALFR